MTICLCALFKIKIATFAEVKGSPAVDLTEPGERGHGRTFELYRQPLDGLAVRELEREPISLRV